MRKWLSAPCEKERAFSNIFQYDRDDAALQCDELKWRISEETAVSPNDGGTTPSQRIIHVDVNEDVQRTI